MQFTVVNILDMTDAIGETAVKQLLSDFVCPKNHEIEHFIQQNALLFAQKKMSVTYLVIGEKSDLAAVFTLTHKPLEIADCGLSATTKKRLRRFSVLDESTGSFHTSAFLIAQFGKNFAEGVSSVPGDMLMELVFEILKKIQHDIGGGLVYLECEDRQSLLDFYQKNLFVPFGTRDSVSDGIRYVQMMRLF